MIPVQALIAGISRSAGKILNTAFGWATVMLFGRIPQDKQINLSVITFGSLLWVLALIGTAFPSVGTWLLGFVKLPHWVNPDWVRLAMIVGIFAIPLAIGVGAVLMLPEEQKPKGEGYVFAILRGYPYTVGLAITLVMLLVLAPVLKVRNILRRWTDRHVPVIVEPQHYPRVVQDLHHALERGGLSTRALPASWMIRVPTRVLTFFAGGSVKNLVAERLTTLVGPTIEILLHPSDLAISGRELDVARTQAILATNLTFTQAYLTWDKEANDLEDRLRRIWDGFRRQAHRIDGSVEQDWDDLDVVENDLKHLKLPYEEWEVVYREILTVRVALLRRHPALADRTLQTVASVTAALSFVAEVVPSLVRRANTVRDPRDGTSAA
jgi:hypothetical protein